MKRNIITFFSILALFGCSDAPEPTPSTNVEDFLMEETEEITDSTLVNPFEIERVIKSHLKSRNVDLPLSRSVAPEFIKSQKGNAAYHIVNFPDNKGWVIISATKNFWPVIAYSEEGHFDYSTMPPGLQIWNNELCSLIDDTSLLTEEHKKEMHELWLAYERSGISAVMSRSPGYEPINPADYSILSKIIMDSVSSWYAKGYEVYQLNSMLYNKYPEIYNEFDELAQVSTWVEYELAYKDVSYVIMKTEDYQYGPGHMIDSRWHQNYPFNSAFPTITTSTGTSMRAYVGCLPVALGQIMFYHKYPQNINWADMSLNYASQTTSEFLYQLAENLNAVYTEKGTEAYVEDAPNVLKQYGYNATSGNFDSSKITSSLSAGRPVLCSSKLLKSDKDSDWHAWIVGGWNSSSTNYIFQLWGCKDKLRFSDMGGTMRSTSSARYFSINWGWGDSASYYADLSTACPSNYVSSTPLKAITDIYPNK